MDAIVLVGGEGTRLRPLTYDIPKQMLPVVDRPMIEHVASWLVHHGVDRLILSLGYRPDAFLEAYPDQMIAGAELVCAVEPELLDTAGAVRFAAERAGVEGTFIVVNGDCLSDFDLESIVSFHKKQGAQATIQLTPVADPSAFGVVPTDAEGRVTAFIEKPPPGSAPTNLINAGCYVLEPTVLARIEAGRRVSIERETFPELVSAGALYALASEEYWLDTGTPEKYLQASLDILRGMRTADSLPRAPLRAPAVFVDPDATVEGDVHPASFVGHGATVAEGAEVADSVVSRQSLVSSGARVSGSVVMAGAVIGEAALVESSIVGPYAVVGASCKVSGWSVLGARARSEDGSVLEGARLAAS